jgi:hypothetical protein
MSLFDRLRAGRDTSIQRHVDLALAPEPERGNLLAAAQRRTWAAEDATRAMAIQMGAALERLRLATAAHDQVLAENVQLRDQVRELGTEVVALRYLRERAQVPRGTDRRCATCHDPMPFGVAHYCARSAEYREEAAA